MEELEEEYLKIEMEEEELQHELKRMRTRKEGERRQKVNGEEWIRHSKKDEEGQVNLEPPRAESCSEYDNYA